MATAGQMPVVGDPEYGDQAALAAQEAAVPETEAPLVEPTQIGMEPTQTGNIAQPPVSVVENMPQQGNRFSGRAQNLMRLPPEVLNDTQRQDTPIETQYKAAMLWDVLAADPHSSPTVRYIARQLRGR